MKLYDLVPVPWTWHCLRCRAPATVQTRTVVSDHTRFYCTQCAIRRHPKSWAQFVARRLLT